MIWGIKEESTPGQESMIARAKNLFEVLDAQNAKILLPAPVVGEFLLRIPPEVHTALNNLLGRSFMVVPFDIEAASHFARIWQHNKGTHIVETLQAEGNTRDRIRADDMIVAVAVARKAECIYSHDHALKTFAKGHIEVRDIPPIQEKQVPFPTEILKPHANVGKRIVDADQPERPSSTST
jgi:predicted nucleic acid-binding protein